MLNRSYQEAIATSTRSVEMATRIGSDVGVARATMTLGTAELVMGDVERGVALVHEAMAMFERLGETTLVTNCYSLLGTGGGEARIYDRAAGWLDEAIVRARQTDSDYTMAYATAWLARIRCEQGRWDEAVALAEAVARVSPEVAKISPVTALGALGRVRVRRGDPGAEEVLMRAVDLGRSGSLQHIWAPLCALAEHYWFQGRLDEAVGLLEDPYHKALQTDSAWARGELGFWLWWVGGLDEAPDRAAEPFALIIAGDWRGAAEAWRTIGCPYEEALALACSDREGMLEALEILDGLGARPAATWLRARLREAGVEAVPRGPRRSTREHPAGLTARQAEVLGLMRQGMGNADIANRLFISRKTVEHHVSAILAKLGVANRAQAIASGSKDGGGVAPT
jgi:ATP/maltotriose-dependent transcriptional regulator MalT